MKKRFLKSAPAVTAALLLSAPLWAAQVTVETGQGVVNYSGEVIVREGGQGRIPITIVGDEKLFQFYEHENKVQRIVADDPNVPTLIGEQTAVHAAPTADSEVVTTYLRGLEIERLGEPNAEGWINVEGLVDQTGNPTTGWIPADVLATEVNFLQPMLMEETVPLEEEAPMEGMAPAEDTDPMGIPVEENEAPEAATGQSE